MEKCSLVICRRSKRATGFLSIYWIWNLPRSVAVIDNFDGIRSIGSNDISQQNSVQDNHGIYYLNEMQSDQRSAQIKIYLVMSDHAPIVISVTPSALCLASLRTPISRLFIPPYFITFNSSNQPGFLCWLPGLPHSASLPAMIEIENL